MARTTWLCQIRTYNILKLITLTTSYNTYQLDPLYSHVMEPEVAPRLPLHPSLCMDCSGVLAITTLGISWNWTTLDHTGKQIKIIINNIKHTFQVFVFAFRFHHCCC